MLIPENTQLLLKWLFGVPESKQRRLVCHDSISPCSVILVSDNMILLYVRNSIIDAYCRGVLIGECEIVLQDNTVHNKGCLSIVHKQTWWTFRAILAAGIITS